MSSDFSLTLTMGQNESELKSAITNDDGGEDHSSAEERLTTQASTSGKTMEWNFINFSKAERCPIFDVDPVMLKKFVGHNVTVYNTSKEVFHGCCLAIDPVSLSVILAKRVPEGKIRIITLPGYYLAKIYVDPESVPLDERVSVNDLDVAELYHAPSLLSSGGSDSKTDNTNCKEESDSRSNSSVPVPDSSGDNPCQEGATSRYSEEDIECRRIKVRDLLTKHKMPFKENEHNFELPGGVSIKPPYTLESCDTKGNQIIKRKIGEVMKLLQ